MLKEELRNQPFHPGEGGLLNKVTTPFFVDNRHEWGYEVHVVNEPEYCCKFLVLDNVDYISSLHSHPKKKETLIVWSGEVEIEHGLRRPLRTVESTEIYREGEMVTVLSGEPHRFRAIGGPAVILEVSTHDDPEDNYKIVPSQHI